MVHVMRYISANDFDTEAPPTYPILKRKPGKFIGGKTYIHRQYTLGYLPETHCWKLRFIFPIAEGDPNYDPHWNILKVGPYSMSFISCPMFDIEPEPVVENSLYVPFASKTKKVGERIFVDDIIINPLDITLHKGGTQVYHHKWMMVGDDYKGFDVEASKARSKWWEARYRGSRAGIGSLKKWKEILDSIKS